MEHLALEEELRITREMDFIVPLKQAGLITRAVLEAIRLYHRPRRIIIVTAREEAALLRQLTPFWNTGPVECIDEETFFQPNFGLSIDDIIREYDSDRGGDQREPGWWIQQLIKLGAATQIPDISPVYVVWDGDLVPTRRWKLCSPDSLTGQVRYSIAILQGESRSEFNTTQYAQCMKALCGFGPLEPPNGGTFVAHHMIFHVQYVQEMLEMMQDVTSSQLPWPLLIMSFSRKYYRFSEYKTYATFMLRHHPDDFHHHEFEDFGEGGLRFREANAVVEDMLSRCVVRDGGLSYAQVCQFVRQTLAAPGAAVGKSLSGKWSSPAYVQLDHVYGLRGIELNLSPAAAAAVAPLMEGGSLVANLGDGVSGSPTSVKDLVFASPEPNRDLIKPPPQPWWMGLPVLRA